MRWSLSLFNWPPLASHFLCFFLGMALVNLSMQADNGGYAWKKSMIYLSLSKEMMTDEASKHGFVLARGRSEKEISCLVVKNIFFPIQIPENDTWMIELPWRGKEISLVSKMKPNDGSKLWPATKQHKSMPLCHESQNARLVYKEEL